MQTASYISGLPRRWAVSLSAMLRDNFAEHAGKMRIVHAVQTEVQRVPVDAGEGALHQAAEAAARECYGYCERYKMTNLILDGIFLLCLRMGVPRPIGATDQDILARATDKGWWLRRLRTEHKRRFEHTAIQLGFTSLRNDPYISRESALRQRAYNLANQKLLESVEVTNGTDIYTLAELAALGTANKAIRRGELMLRIRGMEEIADELRHVGMFWTITCPSKFHSVGGTNPKYNGATPRDAQAYLCKVWARIRAALKRQGIQPYGFRIAEPHSDGCPHWHMLLFVPAAQEAAMSAVIEKYALREDADEKGAKENRVKLVRIEAGMGTAAGYIAKYVSKNIDGHGVGDHKAFESGSTYNIATDVFGNQELTASERVTYWSQVWSIRQFQQIGGAPVGVWRELRRVKFETIQHAPDEIRAAWDACQKIEGGPEIAKQASYADYMRAQGGAMIGRGGVIKLAEKEAEIIDRYTGMPVLRMKPCGIYHAANVNAVYESVRFTWTPVKESSKSRSYEGVALEGAGGFGVPWTGVNNCTQFDYPELQHRFNEATGRLGEAVKNKKFSAPAWVDWPEVRRQAKQIEQDSNKFAWRRNERG